MQFPAQRSVPAAIYTSAGWITGKIHMNAPRALLAQLNHSSGDFIRLTDVLLPHEKKERPFFAIHSREAIFVVPLSVKEERLSREYTSDTEQHEVACLLQQGTLFGRVDVLEGIRLSDYLMHHTAYIPIHRCLTPFGDLPRVLSEPIRFAFLNASRIVGVAEAQDGPTEKAETDEVYEVVE